MVYQFTFLMVNCYRKYLSHGKLLPEALHRCLVSVRNIFLWPVRTRALCRRWIGTVGIFLIANTYCGQFNIGKLAETCNKTHIRILSTLRMLGTSTPFVFEVCIPIHRQTRALHLKYRVSQEECEILRESDPYVKLYRYNPKHLYPKLNGYGDNGQRKVWTSCISA